MEQLIEKLMRKMQAKCKKFEDKKKANTSTSKITFSKKKAKTILQIFRSEHCRDQIPPTDGRIWTFMEDIMGKITT
jgi:hypothetical protein